MSGLNLPYIQQEMIRYGMSIYFALGIVGNIFNCMMFTRHLYRRTPSSIYFLSLSIFGIMYLIWSIVPYIYTLNHSDPGNQSLFYCKVKLYGTHCLGLCLRYAIVFACIDRFFATRTDVRLHTLITVQMATKLVFIMCVICFVIAIHIPILTNIQSGVCGMFGLYAVIYPFYQITVIGILPPVLMSIFSTLSIRNLHQRHANQARARQRDRYLMRMVIAEVIVNVFTSIPYSSYLVYSAVTYHVVDKSAQRLQIESFIYFLTLFLIYLISVSPFYLFILTTKTFRNEFINILVTCWNKYIFRQVRIVPLNE